MSAFPAAFLALAFVVAAVDEPPSAEPTGLQAAFGGTIVSTYPDGRTALLWLEPDGAYRGQGRRGGRSSGRWKLKDGRMCLRQSRPLPIPKSFCTAMVEGGVGTTWAARAVTGEPVRVELRAGR